VLSDVFGHIHECSDISIGLQPLTADYLPITMPYNNAPTVCSDGCTGKFTIWEKVAAPAKQAEHSSVTS